MVELPKKEISFWKQSSGADRYPELTEDIETDVLVIGAGVAGLSAAYLLAGSGKKVIVVEKERIGAGATGHTTGKITSQHGLCYSRMADISGEDDARIYGQANETALDMIRNVVKKEKIECDFHTENNYVFSEDGQSLKTFKKEAEIAQKLGLPAKFITETPLPFPVRAAVRFSNQAKFHPVKYLGGLSRAIIKNGGQIFENTKAGNINHDEKVTVKTSGGTVIAKDVIVATNVPYPWVAHGYYCALEYPLKSYIIVCQANQELKGMYITPGRLPYSIMPFESNGERKLLIGGRSHLPGLNITAKSRLNTLARYATMNFDIESIDYMWSARDYLGYDDKPLVGKLYPWSEHIYAATGFMKWGLTNATAAAIMLHDMITKKHNPWLKTFSPTRPQVIKSIPRAVAKYFS